MGDSDISAGYLGLYNALGAKYQITDELYASVAVTNLFRSTTYTSKVGDTVEAVQTFDTLRAGLTAGYNFSDHVLLESGLIFQTESEVRDVTNDTANEYDGGIFTFAIPIRFKVAF